MKFAPARPYADLEAAARKLIEIANSVEAVQEGRIYIELINGPICCSISRLRRPSTPPVCSWRSIAAGLRSTGLTYVKFTQAGADLFA